MQNKIKILIIILFSALIISNIFFAYKYFRNQQVIEATIQKQQVNSNVLSFTKLFLEKVLRGSSTVSFDDRLLLENAVRDLNDKQIFDSWQTFTKAKEATEVQQAFYTLFAQLLQKITP